MIKTKLRYIIILITLTSSVNGQIICQNDSVVYMFYSEVEIQELNKMISFVENKIKSKTKEENIVKAYHKYLDTLCNDAVAGKDILFIDYYQKIKFFSTVDTSVYNTIWDSSEVFMVQTWDTVINDPKGWYSVNYSINGKFHRLMYELINSVDRFELIVKKLDESGDISATIIGDLICRNFEYNFNNPYHRLWASVVLLTLEESIEKKLEIYLKGKRSVHNMR